ncbi:MAG TPA: hypothetical protein ENH55_13340 [Aurantimonas coralicida]|uniref:Uncharacterized protein n=2 Tax=root TaxID=1 RepID=A0A9C9TGE3_9HYPH|nr:hypothetical protein [Aurantimonas coralicida]HET99655.1 hypothetical protein [Aurantimonas coralicida]
MTVWIVRFMPLEGTVPTDGRFRTEESARKVWNEAGAWDTGKGKFTFRDDFGADIRIDLKKCLEVFTDTDSSAASQYALNEANHEAARAHNLPPPSKGKVHPGSTTH